MSTITTRAGKGSPLTNNEVDANFTNLNTDKAELSGATFTGEIVANAGIALGDNDKATFGAGDDLQIYHDGLHSYIADVGSGVLFLRGESNVVLESNSGSNYFEGTSGGASTIYHAGNPKLATTSTGIDVTGDIHLTDPNPQILMTDSTSSATFNVTLDGVSTNITNAGTNGEVAFHTFNGEKLRLKSGGIDVTGTATMDGLTVDNITIDGNEIDVATGNLTLDVAGDIVLDADGGDIVLKDGGSQFGLLTNDNFTLKIQNHAQDTDIKLIGNDGGILVDALTLDMSAAGAATFNAGADFNGTTQIKSGNELQLFRADNGVAVDFSNDGSGVGLVIDDNNGDGFNVDFNGTRAFRIAGDGSLSTPTAGTSNVRFGVNAGNSIASGGNYNTVVGDEAGTAITTGDENALIGYRTGDALNTGGKNTAVGMDALSADTKGSRSVAIGRAALGNQNFTSATDVYNTAVGERAGVEVTTGVQNTLIGGLAGDALTDADYNVAVGVNALGGDTKGNRNTALGFGSLQTQNFTSPTDSYNTAVGMNSGALITTGVQNTFIGGLAGDALTDADYNTAIGFQTLSTDTLGSRSTAVGFEALRTQNFTSATNSYNTALGFQAGALVTTGTNNTFVGGLAGDGTDDATNCVAVGKSALSANCGDSNTAIGAGALAITTALNSTALGKDAGISVTTGSANTILGGSCATSLTEGGSNVIVGYLTGVYGTALTTGGTNTLIGSYTSATTADASSAVGLGHSIAAATGYVTIGHGNSDIRAAHGVATWGTVSDERYKKDIVDSTAGLSFINALQPRTFKYKTLGELPETFSAYEADSTEVFKNSNTNHGFIAQEVKAAIDADDSIKDGFRLWDDRDDGSQEVAEAALIPVLTKAIQELSAQVDALTARIETLEG